MRDLKGLFGPLFVLLNLALLWILQMFLDNVAKPWIQQKASNTFGGDQPQQRMENFMRQLVQGRNLEEAIDADVASEYQDELYYIH